MWFTFALITILMWGAADLFYKKGTDSADKQSHWKIVIMVGAVMGIHAVIYMLWNGLSFSPFSIIKYLPVSLLYIGSMTIGYVGLRYLELSIASPVQNTSGAVAALLCFLFLGQTMGVMQLVGVALVCAGILWLSILEKRRDDKELRKSGEKVDKKYRTGALALIFPILYCIIDGLGTFADTVYLEGDHPIMAEDEALLAYEFTFLICAVLSFIYVRFIKKQKISIWQERDKGFAAIFETAGQFFYVFAISSNGIVVAPMIASYSIVSVILSRIFLKEKLSRWHYVVIAIVMAGIAVLGIE